MDKALLRQHKLDNALQSALLVATLAALLGLLAWVVGGGSLLLLTLGVVVGLYLANPAAWPRMVTLLYPGWVLHPAEARWLYAVLRELARRAGLPEVPRLYYIPSRVMNAFAVGHSEDAMTALSDELLRRLSEAEVTAVLAHEVSHVANDDLATMAFADLVSRITTVLSLVGQLLLMLSLPLLWLGIAEPPWLALLILLFAPTLSSLVQLALSRNREFEADRSAAELTGDPTALASALAKLERYQGRLWERILMPGRRLPEPSVLRTHPDTAIRIERLLALVPRRTPIGASRAPTGTLDTMLEALLSGEGLQLGRPRHRLTGLWY